MEKKTTTLLAPFSSRFFMQGVSGNAVPVVTLRFEHNREGRAKTFFSDSVGHFFEKINVTLYRFVNEIIRILFLI